MSITIYLKHALVERMHWEITFVTNDEMLIATHNHKKRVRQDPKSKLWYIHRKEMLRIGKFDWVIDSGPYSNKPTLEIDND
jgi:hypothetical protein